MAEKRAVRPSLATLLIALPLALAGCSASAEQDRPRNNGSGAGPTPTGGAGNAGAAPVGAGAGGAPQGAGGAFSAAGSTSSAGGSAGLAGSGGSTAGTGSGGTGVVHPPADTALPYFEDFEDGVANGWIDSVDDDQAPFGSWTIVDDPGTSKVYRGQGDDSDESWAVGGDYRWTDQRLETKFKVVSGAEDTFIVIAVRFASFDFYYYLELTSDRIKLRIRDDGNDDIAEWDNPTPFADGEWHSVGLGAIGSTLTVYYDGSEVLTATDATLAAGGIALAASGAVVAFDDVSVTAQ